MAKKLTSAYRRKITKFQATLLVLFLCVASVEITRFVLSRTRVAGNAAQARTRGDLKAKIHIKEFLDFQCPACAKGGLLLKDYLDKYPSQIYLEVRYYPIQNIHEYAIESATYAECAARQNKFFPFEELLLKRQKEWDKSLRPELIFEDIARQVNLNQTALDACLKDDDVSLTVYRDKSEGKSLGVQSTPSYFVNGKILVGYQPLLDELKKELGGTGH